MPTWPSEFPQDFLAGSYSQEFTDPVVRTEMELGPEKTRRRSTNPRTIIKGEMIVSPEIAQAIIDFWEDDCEHGAIPFDWGRLSVGKVRSYRWSSPPSLSGGKFYKVKIEIER